MFFTEFVQIIHFKNIKYSFIPRKKNTQGLKSFLEYQSFLTLKLLCSIIHCVSNIEAQKTIDLKKKLNFLRFSFNFLGKFA